MSTRAFVKSNTWIAAKKAALAAGLTERDLSLTPMCNACGWRKGGLDSWNGNACKCGHSSPTFLVLFSTTQN